MSMLNKFKKIIFGIFTIFFCFIIIYNLYLVICHYQTRNIYNDFEQIFVYKDLTYRNDELVHYVKSFKKDIEEYGNNTKCKMKKYGANLNGDKGWLKYDIIVYYYDNNDNLINTSHFMSVSTVIYINKINGVWTIDRIQSYP